MKKIITILTVLAIATGAVCYLNFRNTDNSEKTNTQTSSQNQTGQNDKTYNQSSDTKTYPVKIYFPKHDASDNDPSKVFAVDRVSPDLGVAKFSISELLKGPTTNESAIGYFTTARIREGSNSVCDNQDFTINITDEVATLKFCRTFDHIGSMSDGQAESAIRATLLQFSSIKKVVILNAKGDCEFDLSGMNLCKN